MNIAVRFYTRSGNTKKLADAVASAVSVEAKQKFTKADQTKRILQMFVHLQPRL